MKGISIEKNILISLCWTIFWNVILTCQSGVDGLHRKISELRPERLHVFKRDHREVSEVNDLDGQCALVQLRVDLDAVPEPVGVQGGKVLVFLQVGDGKG